MPVKYLFIPDAGGAVELTPSSGSLTVTGNTPSITLPLALTPSTGTISVNGNIPTITFFSIAWVAQANTIVSQGVANAP